VETVGDLLVDFGVGFVIFDAELLGVLLDVVAFVLLVDDDADPFFSVEVILEMGLSLVEESALEVLEDGALAIGALAVFF
jgi:hypothetical protein